MFDFPWEYAGDGKQLIFIKDSSGRTFGVIDGVHIGREEAERRANLFGASSDLLIALKTLTPQECPIVTHHSPNCGFCFALKVIAEAEGPEATAPKNTPDLSTLSPNSHGSSTENEGQHTTTTRAETRAEKSHVAPATKENQTETRQRPGAQTRIERDRATTG